jgi:hypothetical protein
MMLPKDGSNQNFNSNRSPNNHKGLSQKSKSFKKNIPHLNIETKAEQKKMTPEEVQAYAKKYCLPLQVVTDLIMQFNSIREISKMQKG